MGKKSRKLKGKAGICSVWVQASLSSCLQASQLAEHDQHPQSAASAPRRSEAGKKEMEAGHEKGSQLEKRRGCTEREL